LRPTTSKHFTEKLFGDRKHEGTAKNIGITIGPASIYTDLACKTAAALDKNLPPRAKVVIREATDNSMASKTLAVTRAENPANRLMSQW